MKAPRLNKDFGNAVHARPKSKETRFANDGDGYSLDPTKLRSTRFGTDYKKSDIPADGLYAFGRSTADNTTKPEK